MLPACARLLALARRPLAIVLVFGSEAQVSVALLSQLGAVRGRSDRPGRRIIPGRCSQVAVIDAGRGRTALELLRTRLPRARVPVGLRFHTAVRILSVIHIVFASSAAAREAHCA